MNKKMWKVATVALGVFAATVTTALADTKVTAPEDTSNPLFTQPVPSALGFRDGQLVDLHSSSAPKQNSSVDEQVQAHPKKKPTQ